jgi:Delta14-sterol reductase
MMQSTSTKAQLFQKIEPHAFGGRIGAVAFMSLLPLLSIYLWICVNRHGGSLVLPTALLTETPLPTLRSVAFVLGWVAFQIVLDRVLPGKVVDGLKARDGVTLQYRLNGMFSLIVSLGALFGSVKAGVITFSAIAAEVGPMLVVAIVFSFLLAAFLYLWGLRSTRTERRTGSVLYDYFMGSALNPRAGKLDLKMFFESKIGMSSWIVLTLAIAGAQLERDGALSLSMALVVLFQLFYVLDFYFFEHAMLSTWDINNENYGFMLAFGFVVWMPFVFSLQAQYLYYHQPELPLWAAIGIVLLNMGGYYIFRTANLQKHKFRTEPNATIWGKPATFMQTKRGTKLLTSGWWGLSRHANYLGDLMMALAWCLPAGFSHITPYFYFIYFAPLLIDRERRDHHACAEKYGADWDEYCKRVPHRILPGVY